MQRILRNKLVMCVTILIGMVIAVAIAGDVTVKPDEIEVGGVNIYKSGDYSYIEAEERLYLKVGGGTTAVWFNPSQSGKAYFQDAVNVDTDLIVNDDLAVSDTLGVQGVVAFLDDLYVYGNVDCDDNLEVNGKFTAIGTVDPPCVLYDRQSREEIIELIQKQVPPNKQNGAALFFNKETKRLETYVAGEGKFYDLQGNEIYALASPVAPAGEYKSAYYLDKSTGQVKSVQKGLDRNFLIKEGVEFDRETGRFISEITGEEITRDNALEWYVESEGRYYDLQGNFLRSEPREEDVQYVTEYRFDRRTGQIKVNRKAEHDRYDIKEGYRFNKTTGQFVDANDVSVEKEEAVEFTRAADMVNQ